MSSLSERLSKLKEKRQQQASDTENQPRGRASTASTSSRLSALRERRNSSVENRKRRNSRAKPDASVYKTSGVLLGTDIQSEDDEGETTEESDIDEEGKTVLKQEDVVGPMGDDDGLVSVHRPVVSRQYTFAPPPASLGDKFEPHVTTLNKARNKGVLNDVYDENEYLAPLLDEGFFVPEPPKGTTVDNVARLRKRLLRELQGAREQLGMNGSRDPEESEDDSEDDMKHKSKPRKKKGQTGPGGKDDPAKFWFERDGTVRILQDPVRLVPTRPVDADAMTPDTIAEERCATAIPAVTVLTSLGARQIGDDQPASFLDVELHSLVLDDHPLFIKEDLMASKIRGLYRQYHRQIQTNTLPYITNKIQLKLDEAKEVKKQHIEALESYEADNTIALANVVRKFGKQMREIWDAILELFSVRLADELEIRTLAKDIYDHWLELKQMREDQGFTSTNIRISVIEQKPHVSGKVLSKQFRATKQIVDQYQTWLDIKRKKRTQKQRKLKARMERRKEFVDSESDSNDGLSDEEDRQNNSTTHGEVDDSGLKDHLLLSSENMGFGDVTDRIVSKAQDMVEQYQLTRGANVVVGSSGKRKGRRKRPSKSSTFGTDDDEDDDEATDVSPNYELKMTFDFPTSKDEEVSSMEARRRRSVGISKIRVAVVVNGFDVCKTAKVPLTWPNFSAEISRVFRLEVFKRPETITLKVLDASKLLPHTIASLRVPVPAAEFTVVMAQAMNPVDQWYQFSSTSPITNWLWEKPTAKQRKLKDISKGDGGDEIGYDSVRTGELIQGSRERFEAGSIRTCVAWGGRGITGKRALANGSSFGSPMEQPGSGGFLGSGGNLGQGANIGNGQHESADIGFGVPVKLNTPQIGRFIGNNEQELAGGSRLGGSKDIQAEAVSFDDKLPDFTTEVDFQNLIRDIKDLDPNDPRNDSVLRLLEMLQLSRKRGYIFRSQSLLKEVLFPTANSRKFVDSKRKTLLKMRMSKAHLFQQPIPFSDAEIRKDESLQALLAIDDAEDEEDDERAIVSSRMNQMQKDAQDRVNNFLQRVRAAQRGFGQSAKRDIPVSSVVKEGPLPNFQLNFNLFKTLFEPRRRLKPQAQARKVASMSVEKANLFVQVVRATSVPVRRVSTQGGLYPPSPGRSPVKQRHAASSSPSHDASAKAGKTVVDPDDDNDPDVSTKTERVMSFVQVRFQGTSRRSSAQEGPAPTWNESIFLPFVPPRKDFSPSNLQAIKDEVYFNVFDEVVVEDEPKDYRDEDIKFERHERRFLGAFSIPFSTIYLNQKVEGMFRVEKPPMNLGYVSKGRRAGGEDGDLGVDDNAMMDQASELKNSASNATYVYLMATLDPPLATPGDMEIRDPNLQNNYTTQSGEDSTLLKYADHWVRTVKKYNDRTRSANVRVVGTDVDGRSVFITRFLSPQTPPVDANGEELDTYKKLVRFVSLIPFLDDWHAFTERGDDVWSTSQQFLDICAGDWEEHAILLCNYLNYVNRGRNQIQAYIVLGKGIPEGDTIYVLAVNSGNSEPVLWNASTGQGFMVSDKRCPMKDVSLIVNSKNIWANIQEHGEPHKMKWNLDNPKEFMKFFGEKFRAMELPTIQAEQLEYRPVDPKFVNYLESELWDQIQRSIRRWRSKKGTTRFNKIVGRKLKSILVELEEEKLGLRVVGDRDHLAVLRETMATSEIVGFPLNMTFTDIESVLKEVRNTDIHNTKKDNVQFALAVCVYPYVNNILSVWVYVCAISSNRY